MFALLGIRTLDGDIQTYQGFTGTRHTSDKADGFSAMGFAMVDNAIDLVCCDGEIFGTGITAGDIMHIVSAV